MLPKEDEEAPQVIRDTKAEMASFTKVDENENLQEEIPQVVE